MFTGRFLWRTTEQTRNSNLITSDDRKLYNILLCTTVRICVANGEPVRGSRTREVSRPIKVNFTMRDHYKTSRT